MRCACTGAPAGARARVRARRGFVVVAVLVIVLITLLVATGTLYLAQADRAGAANLEASAQARLLAWSGLQIIMDDLQAERERVLDGERPRLDEELIVYETPTRTGVVRLLPMGPAGEVLEAEAGKLDLNTAEASVLSATGFVDGALAQRIVDERNARGGYRSVVDLLAVEGIGPEDLWGPLEDIDTTDAALGADVGLGERVEARLGGVVVRGLADIVTVHAVEPLLQRSGDLRISLRTEWSDELGARIDERYGEGASGVIKGLFDEGERFEGDERICQLLNAFDVELAEWAQYIDGLTGEEEQHAYGRVDINTAPEVVLAALPGIGPDAAAQIVAARDTLDGDEKATIEWPAREELVERAAYDELGGMITTRCWTWRIRLAAGEVDVAEPDGPLENPVIWEVVIDLADPAPRVAYLRDITLLQTAARLVARSGALSGDADEDDPWADERDPFGMADSVDDLGFDAPATMDDLGSLDDLAGMDDLMAEDDPWAGEDEAPGAEEEPEADRDDTATGARDAPAEPVRGRRVGRWIP